MKDEKVWRKVEDDEITWDYKGSEITGDEMVDKGELLKFWDEMQNYIKNAEATSQIKEVDKKYVEIWDLPEYNIVRANGETDNLGKFYNAPCPVGFNKHGPVPACFDKSSILWGVKTTLDSFLRSAIEKQKANKEEKILMQWPVELIAGENENNPFDGCYMVCEIGSVGPYERK